jgi:putative transferase (TIGR04331 family)
MDGEVLEYHWKDRARFECDYNYLDRLYEITLCNLASKLNQLHCRNYSKRYWRILVGPWLATYIHTLYDRWLSIDSATKGYNICGTILPAKTDFTPEPPNDMVEFLNGIRSDEWNLFTYARIIRYVRSIPISEVEIDEVAPFSTKKIPKNTTFNISEIVSGLLRRILVFLHGITSSENDVFIQDPYLTKLSLGRLYFKLGMIPIVRREVSVPRVEAKRRQRKWRLDQSPDSDFERFLLSSIPFELPRYCLEGYERLNATVNSQGWPKRPSVLYSAHALWHDVVSMAYFAENAERGAPILYGQHGGVYGTAKFHFARDHENAVADRYLVWGSRGLNTKFQRKIGITKVSGKNKRRFGFKQRLLFVTLSTSRYSFRLCSESARDYLSELYKSFDFINGLNSNIQARTVVRLQPFDFGWDLQARWIDEYPNISIDLGYTDIYRLMASSKLVAFNYNQTGFLEAMAMGIPSILICDFNIHPLKDEAVIDFEKLADVGIYHSDPLSAAKHLNRIWADVGGWWLSDSVQNTVRVFQECYCNVNKNLVGDIYSNILEMRAQ